MKRPLYLAIAAALLFGACAELVQPAAATVNGRKIPTGEIESALASFEQTAQFEQSVQQIGADATRRRFEQNYLGQLVRRRVLEAVASDLGITVSEGEIEERLDEIKANFPSEEAFNQAVAEQGLTEDQVHDLIGDQVLEQKIRAEVVEGLEPSDEELRSFYDSNVDDYAETRASHILLPNEERADELAEELQGLAGDKLDQRFSKLAEEISEDPGSGANGGDLGYYSPGDFVPEFEDAAADLKIGEVSAPVQSEFGFHIIMVTDRRFQDFEEVREDIAAQLAGSEGDAAYQDFLVDAYRDADVRVNPRFGELDIDTQQIVNASAEDVPGAESSPTPTVTAPSPQT